jgi:hypothetical protein
VIWKAVAAAAVIAAPLATASMVYRELKPEVATVVQGDTLSTRLKGDLIVPPSLPRSEFALNWTEPGAKTVKTETFKTETVIKKTERLEEPVKASKPEREDVCAESGGRRVEFTRHRHVMWRCVYHRRRR